MRNLWKGTTELWTSDMPQDDTWQPNRHHSNMFPLFRNHLTRNAVAMFPPLLNLVTSTEHECRDPHLPAVPHTEDAEEKGRRVVVGRWQNYPTCTAPTTTTPPVPQNLKMLLLRQQTQNIQRQDPSEGMSPPLGQALGNWHGKGDLRVSCVEPSSTTRARLLEPASRSKGNW